MSRRLPRPTLEHIEAVLRAVETGPVDDDGFPVTLKEVDGKLAEAAAHDMRALLSAILSRIGSRKTAQAHGYRTRQILTCLGWIPVRFAYVRKASTTAFLMALGITARSTAAARDRIVRCAALCGSFAEGRGMLRRLTGIRISISKVRKLALAYGEHCLHVQDQALMDVRSYPAHTPQEGEREVARTLFCMLDGTGAPCTKEDTAASEGKNGEAGTRQIRVVVFGEYGWLDKKGRPVPFDTSFSYAVSGDPIADVTGLVRKLGVARGYGTVTRMQCVADGEDAIETALRDAFRDAVFTNDFIHASEHLHTCCENLGLPEEAMRKEYRFLKGLLFRIGATAVIKRLETKYAAALLASTTADKELDYLRKRKQNMCYGKLRKEGFFIASGHVEAAARILVVRRCKQAGMHWRHKNAICISAILAHLRSAA